MAIILMILSIVVHQFEGIFIKKYNSVHEKGGFIFTAIVSLFSMLFFLLTDTDGLNFTVGICIYGMLAGIFYCLASFTTYVALGCGSYVLTRLIISYGILVTIIYGFIIGEQITFLKCVGIMIVLVSLYYFKNVDEEKVQKITKKWIISMAMTLIGVGGFGVLQRQQQLVFINASNEFMVVSLGISAIILIVASLIKESKYLGYVIKNGGLYAIGVGVSNGFTNLLTLIVYTLVPISYSAPVKTGLSIVYSFFVAKIFFKERFSKKQLLGVFLGIIALILLNF